MSDGMISPQFEGLVAELEAKIRMSVTANDRERKMVAVKMMLDALEELKKIPSMTAARAAVIMASAAAVIGGEALAQVGFPGFKAYLREYKTQEAKEGGSAEQLEEQELARMKGLTPQEAEKAALSFWKERAAKYHATAVDNKLRLAAFWLRVSAVKDNAKEIEDALLAFAPKEEDV